MYSKYLEELQRVMYQIEFYKAGKRRNDVDTAFEEICQLFLDIKKKEKMVYFIGNGGSAAIAEHMTADFMKNGGVRTFPMNSPATLTCLGNDFSYTDVFARQLGLMAKKDDLLVAISSSGNSKNIVSAIETMKYLGGGILTLTGFERNNSGMQRGDYNIYVPINHYGIVESLHNMLLQQMVDYLVDMDGIAMD